MEGSSEKVNKIQILKKMVEPFGIFKWQNYNIIVKMTRFKSSSHLMLSN
jgi:hypothetical protein